MRRIRADRRIGLLLAGVLLLVAAAIAFTVVLPAADVGLAETSPAERDFDEQQLHGMRVYRSEGCWYCHTQQPRGNRADAAFGDPLAPGDLGAQSPAMIGSVRRGTDLAHVGARYEDPRDVVAFLRDPRGGGAVTMPSYRHLSGPDLQALAAYLLALG